MSFKINYQEETMRLVVSTVDYFMGIYRGDRYAIASLIAFVVAVVAFIILRGGI